MLFAWLNKRRLYVFDLVLFALFMGQVVLFIDRDIDDAHICYRCAKNFVCGGGLVFTPGEVAEGVTNLSWTLILAGLYRLGFDLAWAGRLLTIVFSGLFFFALRGVSLRCFGGGEWRARIPLLAVVCATHVSASFGNMLEGPAYVFVLCLLLWGMISSNWLFMSLVASVTMTLRPEGMFVAVLAGMWLAFEAVSKRVAWRDVFYYMAVTECALLSLMLFRFWYYGDILPNTLRAKNPGPDDFGSPLFFREMNYVLGYLRYLGIGMAGFACAGLLNRRWRSVVAAGGVIFAFNVIVVGNYGDWMSHYRLMTPYYLFVAFAAGAGFAVLDSRGGYVRWAARCAMVFSLAVLALPSDITGAWTTFKWESLLPKTIATPSRHINVDPISRHIVNLDLAWPGNMFWGGGESWYFDGVPEIEICGLTDRGMRAHWPDLQDHASSGVSNWRYLLSDRTISGGIICGEPYGILGLIQLVPDIDRALSNYVVATVKDQPVNAFLLRDTLPVLPLFLRDFGDFSPACDFITAKSEKEKTGDLTPWQYTPWQSAAGPFETGWRSWGDTQRVSVAIPVQRGKTVLRRALPDASPILLMAGIMPGDPLEARLAVRADTGTDTPPAVTLYLAGNGSSEFVTMAEGIPRGLFEGSSAVTLDIVCDTPGVLYLAAYRWTNNALPTLPSFFVRERWRQSAAYCEKHGMAGEAAAARTALEAFEGGPAAAIERWIADKTEIFAGALFLRYAVLNHPLSESARDAMDAYYKKAGDTEAWVMEWEAQVKHDPERAAPRARLARAYLYKGDREKFFEALEGVVTLSLSNGAQRAWMADVLGRYKGGAMPRAASPGESPGALEALTNGFRPENAKSALDCICFMDTLGYDDAVERNAQGLLSRLKAAAIYEPFAWETMAKICAKKGDAAGARAYWRGLIEYMPDYAPGFDALFEAYGVQPDLEASLSEWRGYTERHPESARGWFYLGRTHESRKEFADAMTAFQRVLSLKPDALDALDAWNRTAMMQAQRLLEEGNFSAANALLEQLKEKGVWNALYCETQAQLREKEGDLEGARALYRRLLETNSDYAGGFDALSATYEKRDDLEGLLTEWLTFTKERPETAQGWLHLGRARELRREYSGAMAAYERALALKTDSEGVQEAWNRVALNCVHQLVDNGNAAEADALCARLRAAGVLEPAAWEIPARHLAQAGNLEGARALYRESAGRMPDSYPAFEALSATYTERGDLDGLLAEWSGFTQRYPETHLGWFCLGIALERRHDYPAALEAFRRGLELRPSAQGTREAMERVESKLAPQQPAGVSP